MDKTKGILYCVVSEGCSSTDVSVTGFDSKKEADRYKKSSAKAGFNTSNVIEVPEALASHPAFFDVADKLVKSVFWLSQ